MLPPPHRDNAKQTAPNALVGWRRYRSFYWSAGVVTLVLETATILARVLSGQSAAEFNRAANPPLLLKMHHLFWAVPLLLVGLALRRTRRAWGVFGVAAGFVASDLIHHFVVLPLWVGNTGWHWP